MCISCNGKVIEAATQYQTSLLCLSRYFKMLINTCNFIVCYKMRNFGKLLFYFYTLIAFQCYTSYAELDFACQKTKHT